jgi:hypothetical protein
VLLTVYDYLLDVLDAEGLAYLSIYNRCGPECDVEYTMTLPAPLDAYKQNFLTVVRFLYLFG